MLYVRAVDTLVGGTRGLAARVGAEGNAQLRLEFEAEKP
jgi:hypothetical protein